MPADVVLTARWIIPVEPADTVLEHHALVIREGRIEALCDASHATAAYPDAFHVHLPRHVLIPGLVNAHTHLAMNLLRGVADDLPLMTWLTEHIWPRENRWVSHEFVADGTRLALAESIRGGVTTVNDMYFFPEAVVEAAREAGMRARIGMIVLDFPTAYADSPEGYFTRGDALRCELAGDPLLAPTLAPHAPYTVGFERLERIAALSARHDLPVHIHVHETAAEVIQYQDQHGRRPWEGLHQAGLLNARLLAVHMTQLTDGEIDQLVSAGAHALHCPESNLKLASGFCPVAKLLAAGANVALGSDGAASNNDLDMLGEMRTAALLAKGVSGDAAALPAAQALEMATMGGARALGWADRIGSLVVGKAADVVAVDLGDDSEGTVNNPVSQLVYAGRRDQVSDVWVGGRRLLRDGELMTLDSASLAERARRWSERMKG